MNALLQFIRENQSAWTLLVVFAGAALEYMAPPLPADSIVLAASLLIIAGAWSLPTVFAFAVAGGLTGSLVHYYVGRALAREDGGVRGGGLIEKLTGKGTVDRFFGAFRKHGMWVIALNRFFPGVRAGVFIAAGAARLPIAPTMLLGLISNAAWTFLLLSLGVAVGGNWEAIERTLRVYSCGLLILIAVVIACYVAFRWVRRRRHMLGSAGDRGPE